MKKSSSKRRKAPHRKRRAGPKDTFFPDVDLDLVRRLLADRFPSDEEDLVDMVQDYLSLEPDIFEDMPDDESIIDLDRALDRTRLKAAGGDARARETLDEIRATIDEAANRDAINPAMLMMLGRSFAAANVEIGNAARSAMRRAVEFGDFRAVADELCQSFIDSALLDAQCDPFVIYEELAAAISILPLHCKSEFVARLMASPDAAARRVAMGFLLDREAALAEAAINALGALPGRLDDERRRWIATMRPWLSPARRAALDRALTSSGPVIRRSPANVMKAIASVCDGSGVSFLIAIMKSNSRCAVASVMLKPKGVTECIFQTGLSTSEAAAFERALCSSTLTSEISLASWERLLRLALGRNLASDEPPPFDLIRVVEALGLDPLEPDLATPAEIIALALADVLDRDRPDTVRAAHEFMGAAELAENWFEAGPEVEALLKTTQAPGAAATALLDSYLPSRRPFWGAQCARSSLALKEAVGPRDETWKHLAVVGRDILGDVPLSEIRLMRRIADRSALACFMQRIARPAAA
jgi:hypothetical protein